MSRCLPYTHAALLLCLAMPLMASADAVTHQLHLERISKKLDAMSQRERAEYLLQNNPQSQNTLALEQAKSIVAGEPGKRWKNCILDREAHLTMSNALAPD